MAADDGVVSLAEPPAALVRSYCQPQNRKCRHKTAHDTRGLMTLSNGCRALNVKLKSPAACRGALFGSIGTGDQAARPSRPAASSRLMLISESRLLGFGSFITMTVWFITNRPMLATF